MSKVTVVMYHYVRNLRGSAYPRIKGLDLNSFNEQIKYFLKNYNVISMEEFINSIDNNVSVPEKSLLLTFDDAYIDHYENVYPILKRNNIQGSFYAPVKALKENLVLDVNKIHFILASTEDYNNIIDDIKGLLKRYQDEYSLKSFEYYYEKLAVANHLDNKDIIFIKRLLQKELIEELRKIFVDYLFEKYLQVEESDFSKKLYMNEEQLSFMNAEGMHIGNHGYNHYWWNALKYDVLKQEIELATDFLKKIGVSMDTLTASYPYGSYCQDSIELLSKMNYKVALTTEVDIGNTLKKSRYIVPRLDTIHLPMNSDSRPNDWYLRG